MQKHEIRTDRAAADLEGVNDGQAIV